MDQWAIGYLASGQLWSQPCKTSAGSTFFTCFLEFRSYEATKFTCFRGASPRKTAVWLHFRVENSSQTVVLGARRLPNHVFYEGLEAPEPWFLGPEAGKASILRGFEHSGRSNRSPEASGRAPDASGRAPEGPRMPQRPPGASQEASGVEHGAETTYFTCFFGCPERPRNSPDPTELKLGHVRKLLI